MQVCKKTLFLFLVSSSWLLTACATFDKHSEPKVTTMKTDLDKSIYSRSQYYQDLADNHFQQSEFLSAIDLYRLSLLHDDTNYKSRFGLAKAYISSEQSYLALAEFEKLEQSKNIFKLTEIEFNFLINFYFESKSYIKAYDVSNQYLQKTESVFGAWKVYESALKLNNATSALEALKFIELKTDDKFKVSMARYDVGLAIDDKAIMISALDAAETVYPFDELLLKKKMQFYTQQKDWSKVIHYGRKYIKYQKHTLPVSELLVNAGIKSEDYQLAVDELQWQSKYSTDTSLYDLKIAHLYFLLKNYSLAEEKYKQLYGYPQFLDEIKYYLSLIYDETQRYSDANSILEEIKDTSVYYADAQVKLAEIDYKNGDKVEAINRLRKAHLVKKDSIAIYKAYSEFLIENQNYVEAVALLEKGIQNTLPNEVLHMNMAFCHYKLRNYKKFRSELDTAMSINPSNVKIYEMLAELWYNDDKRTSEIEYFAQIAMKLGSKNENLMKILAWTLVDQNKLDKAVVLFENLFDENPKDYFYSEMLSKIYSLKNIHFKAAEFSMYARTLRHEENLKNYLNEQLKSRNIRYRDNDFDDQRMPASLEQ